MNKYTVDNSFIYFFLLNIFQVSAERKPVGSTSGMQTSVQTSKLLKVETLLEHCLRFQPVVVIIS